MMVSRLKSIEILSNDILFNQNLSRLAQFKSSLSQLSSFLLDPLKNRKNAADRKKVEDASLTPVNLPGFSQEITLTSDIIKDVISLSDLFAINEMDALELVLTAEGSILKGTRIQSSIFLFFKHFLSGFETIRLFIQSINGKTWSPTLDYELQDLISTFLQNMQKEKFIEKFLEFLTTFNVNERLEILINAGFLKSQSSEVHALRSLLLKIRFTISEVVFFHCLQFSVKSQSIEKLIGFCLDGLSSFDNGLSFELMNLIFAVLYSFVPFCSCTNLDQASDLQSVELEHEFFKESGEFHVQMASIINTKFNQVATDELNVRMGFLALLRLTLVINQVKVIPLRNELLLGGNQNDEISNRLFASDEEIDETVSWSLERGSLEFIHEILLGQPNFHCTSFSVLFVHSLVTDLIANMPLRVRELRLRDEECIRRTGQDPSIQGSGFARLLNLLSELYNVPGSPLHARLSIEFWWPSSNELLEFNAETQKTRDLSKKTGESNQSNADNMKQAALLRFLRQVADMILTAHSLFVPFLRLLKALCLSKPAATHCFNMLHSSSSVHSQGLHKVGLISWEHFLASLHQYYEHLCQSMEQNPDDSANPGTRSRNIQPEEMEGLMAVLQLIRRVVSLQPKVADVLCGGEQKLQLMVICFGLMSCPVSLSLKAELLLTVSAFVRTNSARGAAIWSLFASTSLFGVADANQLRAGGLQVEMNEMEPRVGEYPLTRAFLCFVTSLAPHIWSFFDNNRWLSNPDPALPSTPLLASSGCLQQDSAEVTAHKSRLASSMLRFLVDCIFLKHGMRLYTNQEEKGEIASSCLVLFNLMVRQFVDRLKSLDLLPTSSRNLTPPNWPLSDPGYQLANSILMASQLFKVIFGMLQLSSHLMQKCRQELSRVECGSNSLSVQLVGVPRSTLAALDMFLHLMQHENPVIALTRRVATQQNLSDKNLSSKLVLMESNSSLVPLSLFSKLLLSHVNSSTGQADFPATLLRYVALASHLPRHATLALQLFDQIISRQIESNQGHRQLLNQLLTSEKASVEIMETFVACLDEEMKKHDLRMLEDNYPETPLVPDLVETWAYSVGQIRSWDPQQMVFGHSQLDLVAPNQKLAAIHAGVPNLSHEWPVQFLTSWSQMPSWNHLYTASFESQPQLRSLLLKLFLKMLKALDQPNLVHWALGFRVDDLSSLRNSVLQDAGVANCPKTCLHAFLGLISRGTNILRACVHQLNNSKHASSFEETALATACDLGLIWHILHQVAQDTKTGDILLRYLRSNYDLVIQQCSIGILAYSLPEMMYQSSKTPPTERSAFKDRLLASICTQQSWFLRILALELMWVSRGACSKAYAQRLTTQLCISSTQDVNDIESFNDDLISTVTMQPKSIIVDSLLVKTLQHGLKALLCSTAYKDSVNAGPVATEPESAKSFKTDLMGQAMKNCFHKLDSIDCSEFKSSSKTIINLRQVELHLNEAVANLLTLLVTQQVGVNPVVFARICSEALATWADKFNLHVLLRDSADSVLVSWLQVVSVSSQLMLSSQPMQPLSIPRNSLTNGLELLKQNLHTGLQILEKIFEFVSSCPMLDAPTSGTLVTLTEACLSLFSASSHVRTAQENGEFSREELASFIDCLTFITTLIPATQASKKATANLYASLSHLLRLCSVLDPFIRLSHSDPGQKSGVIAIQCYQVLMRLFFHTEPSFTDNSSTPLHCIKIDALTGQPVIVRLTALSLLTHFLELEALCSANSKKFSKKNHLLRSLASDTDNFVNTLSLSLLEDVEQMEQALASNENISVTQFSYQVKMSLFCQIASCEFGAQLIEKSTLVLSLAKCGLFSKISSSALVWDQIADLARQEKSTLAQKVLSLLTQSIDQVAYFGSCNLRQMLHFALSCEPNEDCQSSRWELFMNVQLPVMRLFQTLVQNLGMKHDALVNQLLCFFKRHQLAILHDPDVNALDKPLSTLLVATRSEIEDTSAVRTRLLISRYCVTVDTVVSHLAAITCSSQVAFHDKNKRRNTNTEQIHSLPFLPHALAQIPIVLESMHACLNSKGSDFSMSRFGNMNLNSMGPSMWSALEREFSFTQFLNWTGRLLATIHSCMPCEEDVIDAENLNFPFALEFQHPSESPISKNCLSTLISIVRVALSVLLSVEQKCVRILALIERQLAPFLNDLGDSEEETTKNRPGNRAIHLVLQTGALAWLLNPLSESETVFSTRQASSLALDELLQLVSTIYGNTSSSWTSDNSSDYKRGEQKMLSKLVNMGCEDLLIRQVEAAKTCLELALSILWRHLELSLDLASRKKKSCIWKGLIADQELDRRYLSPELFDELKHVSLLAFVSSTDHLFIKAFVKRLERFVNEVKMVRQSNIHSGQEQPSFNVFRGLGTSA